MYLVLLYPDDGTISLPLEYLEGSWVFPSVLPKHYGSRAIKASLLGTNTELQEIAAQSKEFWDTVLFKALALSMHPLKAEVPLIPEDLFTLGSVLASCTPDMSRYNNRWRLSINE
jgi:hypothetical protein